MSSETHEPQDGATQAAGPSPEPVPPAAADSLVESATGARTRALLGEREEPAPPPPPPTSAARGVPPPTAWGFEPAAGPASTDRSAGVPATLKSPVAAVLLSFFPGLGQAYNGQVARALTFFGVWTACIYLSAEGQPLPWALVMAFTHLYAFVDAYRGAVLANARARGGALEPEARADSPLWGVTLVALGTVLLINNLGWVRLVDLQRFWPLALIVAGIATLVGGRRQGGAGR